MQLAAGVGGKADDIAGIGGNAGLIERQMKHAKNPDLGEQEGLQEDAEA